MRQCSSSGSIANNRRERETYGAWQRRTLPHAAFLQLPAEALSMLQRRRAEEDFVDIHFLGLRDREGDDPRETVGRDGIAFIEIGDAGRDIGLGNALRQFR